MADKDHCPIDGIRWEYHSPSDEAECKNVKILLCLVAHLDVYGQGRQVA